jgi:uncharacterized protein YheU (UPF0270 family)
MRDQRDASDAPEPVEVPHEELPPDVLRRLVEEFVTRDGTDYGLVERTLDEKVALVMRQLERGEAAIEVQTKHDRIDIVSRVPSRS